MKKIAAIVALLTLIAGSAVAQSPFGGQPMVPNSSGSGGGGSGTVTSIATACGLSGGTVTTTGTIRGQENAETQSGTNYAFQDSDCGKLKILSNASNQVPTLGAIGSGTLLFASGGVVDVCNQGAGTQTLTPTTSTIGGSASYVLAAGTAASPRCVTLVANGTNSNYEVLPYGSTVTGANPTATAGPTANNGVATTFMRSDASPAVQQGSNAQKGIVQVDDTSIGAASGVIGTKAFTGDCTTSAGAVALTCRQTFATYIVNNWYSAGSEHANGGASNSGVNGGVIRCYPEYFHGPATISALGGRVNTVSAGGNFQVAIYANNASTGRPTGTALVSSASMSTTSAAAVSTTQTTAGGTISLAVTGTPLLWWCTNSDNGTSQLNGFNTYLMSAAIGSATQGNVQNGSTNLAGVSVTQAYGTWPDMTSASFTEVLINAGIGTVQFRIGSVP